MSGPARGGVSEPAARRFLRHWHDAEGALRVELYGDPADGVCLWRALVPIRRHLIVRRRGVTPNEPVETLDYDALMTLASVAVGEDTELGFADLVGLGLFPTLGRSGSVVSSPVAPDLLADREERPAEPGGIPPDQPEP